MSTHDETRGPRHSRTSSTVMHHARKYVSQVSLRCSCCCEWPRSRRRTVGRTARARRGHSWWRDVPLAGRRCSNSSEAPTEIARLQWRSVGCRDNADESAVACGRSGAWLQVWRARVGMTACRGLGLVAVMYALLVLAPVAVGDTQICEGQRQRRPVQHGPVPPGTGRRGDCPGFGPEKGFVDR